MQRVSKLVMSAAGVVPLHHREAGEGKRLLCVRGDFRRRCARRRGRFLQW